jgi:protein-S-isoprenylcysteine O-methyltransferase Ste14
VADLRRLLGRHGRGREEDDRRALPAKTGRIARGRHRARCLRPAFPGVPSWRADTVSGGTLAATIGVALCAFGIGLAIWARAHLGRNWGMPMARMESPELVTSGPYAFVRHPIYTGMLTAMLGSTFGESPLWLVPLVLFGIYFVYSARNEEKLMLEQFPEQYPEYMSRTKMLVPFVL